MKLLLKEVIKHQEANSMLLLYIISNGEKKKLKRFSEAYEKLAQDKNEIWNFDFNDDPIAVN